MRKMEGTFDREKGKLVRKNQIICSPIMDFWDYSLLYSFDLYLCNLFFFIFVIFFPIKLSPELRAI